METRTLRSYFQDVERLVIDFQCISKQGDVLQSEHQEYGPDDKIMFTIACPGGCGDGQVNLHGKISDLVSGRKNMGDGQAKCAKPLYSSDEICGSETKCRFSLEYRDSV
jgi:hypothetical protein